ncbi:hypothetical protein SDC9_86343 [bioreactor metagenome]|uniref:Uncharacterized protein n=1 Tax=bioreactor metagenome TaxID=1076179 RepID=A0A644ZFZ5_9ZZZZ|nr:ferritin-like domain-containing protein [Oscillibacter sp.]
MQQQVQDTYDYRQYDRVWQRVAPTLDPYPGMQSGNGTAQPPAVNLAPSFPMTEISGANQPGIVQPNVVQPSTVQPSLAQPGFPQPSVVQPSTVLPSMVLPSTAPPSVVPSSTAPLVGSLPAAADNLCCMGAAAMGMSEALQGFIEDELADRRYYMAFSCQGPGWARQTLRDTAEDEGGHARRLMAAYYLITGQCYQPAVSCERICVGQLCPALRDRYHAEACGALNYAQAADATTDPCLAKLLNELSEDEYRHAERMLVLLERGMKQQ